MRKDKHYIAMFLIVFTVLSGLVLTFNCAMGKYDKKEAKALPPIEVTPVTIIKQVPVRYTSDKSLFDVIKDKTHKFTAKKVKDISPPKQDKAKPKVQKKEKGDKTWSEGYNVLLSKKDIESFYKLVQAEVGNVEYENKLKVASVILNRVISKAFPDTVYEVVNQNGGGVYQFSPVRPGSSYWSAIPTDNTKKAVNEVIRRGDLSNGALYFVAPRYCTDKAYRWFTKNLAKLDTIGDIVYFK